MRDPERGGGLEEPGPGRSQAVCEDRAEACVLLGTTRDVLTPVSGLLRVLSPTLCVKALSLLIVAALNSPSDYSNL